MVSNRTSEDTISALRDGDHKAFEEVFRLYYGRIKVFIAGLIKSEADAEELTEELFVNLWINRSDIDAAKSFNAYLHTIAHHMVINFLKRKYVHADYLSKIAHPQYSYSSEEELIAQETSLLLQLAIERMPEQRKQVFLLSKNEGLKNEEIAVRLQTTKRNVESQLSIALKELRKLTIYLFTLLLLCKW